MVDAATGSCVDILRVDTTRLPARRRRSCRSAPTAARRRSTRRPGSSTFPGGAKKFTIRYDAASELYWSLATHRRPSGTRAAQARAAIRNTLALTCSPDLQHWTVRCDLLYHPDIAKHGFQYVDWLFDGDDIIAACRTAYDDGLGGAHNNHDANFLTFHRIAGFSAGGQVTLPLPTLGPTSATIRSRAIEGGAVA